MTPEQIELVKTSWKTVQPISETAANLFYNRLFESTPLIREMFKGDMHKQGAKLMSTIGIVVNSLDNLNSILPAVKTLAVNHVKYGVEPQHYDDVGSALLWTLEQGLGDAFTEELKEAWGEAYGVLASTMKAAAYPEIAA